MAVTVARLTGAEGSELRLGAAVSNRALLTVLTLVTLRTRALLHTSAHVIMTLDLTLFPPGSKFKFFFTETGFSLSLRRPASL